MGTKKAVKKAKSTLNKAGIRLLADDLVAHKKRYNQQTFGEISDELCGTVCCLAGFCSVRKYGLREFNRWLKGSRKESINARVDGAEQLGISPHANIFDSLGSWPDDLRTEYYKNGPRGRVVVALKALQRLRPNGTIDPNPKKIHTRLPQLKALLAEQAKASKKVKAA